MQLRGAEELDFHRLRTVAFGTWVGGTAAGALGVGYGEASAGVKGVEERDDPFRQLICGG